MKTNIYGDPVKPLPKCIHCGKTHWDHKAKTQECPIGLKHRTVGHTSFGPKVFTPYEPK